VVVLKYGKPIWQLVAEAADRLEGEVFTASDIVKKVHETNPDVPEISIKSYVTAMAPNHSFSGHWPSIRKNHPYFYYLGDGKFRLLKPAEKPSSGEHIKPV